VNFLNKYKKFLIDPPGLEGQWCNRYKTFEKAFKLLEENFQEKTRTIVELGTTRSYVGGHLEGCLSSDDRFWKKGQCELWDWSAGCFTIIAAEYCNESKKENEFYTVDLSKEHLRRSKKMTEDIYNKINYIESSSESFLKTFDGNIDFLYIDTGNPDSHTRNLQLREAKVIVERQIISKKGIILIDDAYRPDAIKDSDYVNKSEYSVPYFLLKGFELVYSDYQTLLIKK